MTSKRKQHSEDAFNAFEIVMHYTEDKFLHLHDFHEFFFCLDGSGAQVVSSGDIPMQTNDLFFFPAGCLHIGNGAPHENCLGGVINFAGNAFSKVNKGDEESCEVLEQLEFRAANGVHRIVLNQEGIESTRDIFSRIRQETDSYRPGYRSALKICFQELLLTILRCGDLPRPRPNDTLNQVKINQIQKACFYLENNFQEPITVKQMAELTNLSRSYFQQLFQEQTGRTMLEYLNRIRVNTAEHMLRETDLPTDEIAHRCGFPSTSNFYRTLRLTLQKTPSQLRNESSE